MFGAPVGGKPRSSNLSTTPRPERHLNVPVSRSIAVSEPHGGCWQGFRSWSQNREFGDPRPLLPVRHRRSSAALRHSVDHPHVHRIHIESVRVRVEEEPPQFAPPFVPGKTTVGLTRQA